MASPAALLTGQPVIGQCKPFAAKKNGAGVLSSKELDLIIQNADCNSKFIQPLLDLLSFNDPAILGKALMALMLIREKGAHFTQDQEEAFSKRLNTAQVKVVDGGIRMTGKDFSLPNGATLDEGTICFKDGKWFVAAGYEIVISGMKIENTAAYSDDITIYFDGKEHENKGYISLSPVQGTITLSAKPIGYTRILFSKENPFISIDEQDKVAVEADNGMVIIIENRIDRGLIPKVVLKPASGKSGANINNGWIQVDVASNGQISVERGMLTQSSEENQSSTAPLEIVLVNNNGKPREFFGANKGHRLVFDNYSQLGLLASEQKTGSASFSAFGAGILNRSNLISFSEISTSISGPEYTIERFHSLYPNIKLTGFVDSTNIMLAMKLLKFLPPKALESIQTVDFPKIWERGLASAYATNDGAIHLRRSTLNLPNFQHECSHILTLAIEARTDQNFATRWKEIAGDIYGDKYIEDGTKYDYPLKIWKDEVGMINALTSVDMPKHGCIRPYGATTYYEDIATFVEKVWENPDFFAPLLDSNSFQYDPRYKQKLDMLLEYGFISQDKYDKVVNVPSTKIDTAK